MRVRISAARTRGWLGRRLHVGPVTGLDELRAKPEFAPLRERIAALGTDSLAYFGHGFTHEGGLYLQQNPDEFAALCLFLKERGPWGTYMEIGSASGGACLTLYREVGFATLLSLDDGQHRRAAEQDRNFAQVPGIRRYLGDSHGPGARRFLEENLPGKIDVAFIDGDHSAQGVWQDIELTLPFCRPGALLLLHDTVVCRGVEKAWIRAARERLLRPLAEFIGPEPPMGIAVGEVLASAAA
ncbi:MAG TPA: class I SAM-dependent methyltransferase [Longimicrobium sp.]